MVWSASIIKKDFVNGMATVTIEYTDGMKSLTETYRASYPTEEWVKNTVRDKLAQLEAASVFNISLGAVIWLVETSIAEVIVGEESPMLIHRARSIKLDILFDSLRKNEYLSIIAKYYNTIPEVPNTKIYQACKKLYCNIPQSDALKLTYTILKERNNSELLINYINKIPYSIFSYILGIDNKQDRIKNLNNIFNKELKELL